MLANAQQKQRKPRGLGKRFEKGVSGNPRGRTIGSKNRLTLIAESIMDAGSEQIAQAVVAAAAKGDMSAAKLVLDRIAPLRRGRPVEFPLNAIDTAADVVSALGQVARAMAAGLLSPDEAQAVAGVIELKRKALETVELERRLLALEHRVPR